MGHLGQCRLVAKGQKAVEAEYLQVVIAVGEVTENPSHLGRGPVTKYLPVVMVVAGVTEAPSRLGQGLVTIGRKVAEAEYLPVIGNG